MLLATLAASSVLAQAPAEPDLETAYTALREGAPGQEAFDEAVGHLPALLATDDLEWVRGAAWRAGEHGRGECVAALIERLRRPAEGKEAILTRRHVYDALVRLRAEVPAEVLLADDSSEFANERFLLMTRREEVDGTALLALRAQLPANHQARWAATCELGLARDGGIAAPLLTDEVWEVDVEVVGDGTFNDMIGIGGGAGGKFGGRRAADPPWPPRSRWVLHLPKGLKLDAPEAVRRSFRTVPPSVHTVGGSSREHVRSVVLRHLLGRAPERMKIERRFETRIVFANLDQYEGVLRDWVDRKRSDFGRVTRKLEELGLLEDAAAVTAAVRLRIELDDTRPYALGVARPKLTRPELPGVEYAD